MSYPTKGGGLIVWAESEFRFDLPKYLSQLSCSGAQIVRVFRAEMVRLAASLGDSGAVEALIRLGLGREDRVLVFRCDLPRPRRLRSEWSAFREHRTRSIALSLTELRVRAASSPSLSPNFAQFRSGPRRPNVEKHFAKL